MNKKLTMVIAHLFTILDAINVVFIAIIVQMFVDVATAMDSKKIQTVMFISIFFIIWNFIISYTKDVLQSKAIYLFSVDKQNKLIGGLLHKNEDFIEPESEDKYLSIISSDIITYQNSYLKSIFTISYSGVAFVMSIYLLTSYSILVFIVATVFSLMPLLVSKFSGKKLSELIKVTSNNKIELISFLKEMIGGLFVIKSFNAEDKIEDKCIEQVERVEKANYKSLRFNALVGAISGTFGISAFIAVWVAGSYEILTGSMTVGAMLACIQLTNNIVYPVINISSSINAINSTKFIRNRFEELTIKEKNEDKIIDIDFKQLKLEDIGYTYEDTGFSLKNIDFSLEKGKKYVLVGKSGSGKSTILKLLLNPNGNYTGKIKINDNDASKIGMKSYRDVVGTVQQGEFIFEGTIRENITLFKTYSDEEINEAIKKSNVSSILEKRGLTLDSKIDNKNLSGGEKQRISIARCLLKGTSVMLFDEITASLDNLTTKEIEDNILNLKNITCLTVTHRLNKQFLSNIHEIIVVNNGEIVEIGSFDDLMKEDTLFKSLYAISN